MRKQRETRQGVLVTAALSIILLWIWTGFNEEAFLIDDNRTQWYPVMEKAYGDILEGRIYYYDFYQMKGMSIAEQGYYGIMNPFMLLSYCIAHYTPLHWSAITIYIIMLFVMGNIFFYLVCRSIGCHEKLAILMMLSYCTAGCFASFYYWYYVYNNYFMIPLLLYVFLAFGERKAGYFVFGIILALDLYLGNAQYTCYHYILFCILCMVMVFIRKFRFFLVMCTNILTGVLLSLPLFVLLKGAAGNFGKNENFFDYPVYLFSMLLHSFVPHGILHVFNQSFSLLGVNVMSRRDNLVLYMGAPFLLLCVFMIVQITGIIKKAESEMVSLETKSALKYMLGKIHGVYDKTVHMSFEKQMIFGCVVILFCFLSLAGEGVAAAILNRVPVICNFRYLFKAIFVIVPLVNLIAAFAMKESKSSLGKAAAALTVFFVCIGIFNSHYTIREVGHLFDMRINSTYEEEKEYAVKMLEQADVDYKNYRTATFLKFAGVNDEHFDCSRNLTKNFGTGIGAFTLAGYEIAISTQRLKEFDAIYSDNDFFTVYGNADTAENFYLSLTEQPERLQRQLVDNSVKYLLVDKSDREQNQMVMRRDTVAVNEDYEEKIIKAIKEMPMIDVEHVVQLNENYDLIVLSGINSLCTNQKNEFVPLNDENMQTLTFEAANPGIYCLAFSYDSHLQAYVETEEGVIEPLAVMKVDNGTILIDTNDKSGMVCLTYENIFCKMGFVWEMIVSVMFIAVIAVSGFYANGKADLVNEH